jgi:hypothetical protein
MTRCTIAAALILASIASPAWADGKCGNGGGHKLFQFSRDEMVIPWAIPVPANAKVRLTEGKMINDMTRRAGADSPAEFPKKYTEIVKQVELFNSTMATSVKQLLEVEERYGIDMSKDATAVFDQYAKAHNDFVITLVEHPAFSGSTDVNARCSVVLQRGVIEFSGGRETLHLRSQFHSTNGAGGSVNFVPNGAVEIEFETSEIWFPLSLTKLIGEPASYVVLDVVTPDPMKSSDWGRGLKVAESKKIELNGKAAFLTRATGKFDSGKDLEDFRLKP